MSNDTSLKTAIDELKHSLPENAWTESLAEIEPHLKEWRDRWQGHTPLLLTPRTTEQVSQALQICTKHQIPVTLQGGNTGLVGGQIPLGEILVSTKYLKSVREQTDYSITVEAGCILQKIHELADKEHKRFPLSLASQGSANIGGLCSTNAGGVNVVRYGSMRDLVIGLEVVLADGRVFDSLNLPKKDNTGYNITPLFLGAEGTLGIITAVKLKLFNKPKQQETLFLALDNVENSLNILNTCKNQLADDLSLIELIPSQALDFVTSNIPTCSSPFTQKHAWYVLLQFESVLNSSLLKQVEALVETLLNKNFIQDAVIAQSLQQSKALIKLRESISEAQKPEGGSIKHDISVPIKTIPEFLDKATFAVRALVPNCRPIPFGHLGDGNIHFNISQPVNMDKEEYLAHWEAMNHIVHDIVVQLGGSISAEHGIGILKKKELAQRCDPVKMAMMKSIKQALDPDNIFNPRVLF